MTGTVATQTDPNAIAERARRFVDEQLIPRERAAERAGGRLPADEVAAIRAAALEAGLAGGLHAVEHGGQGWSHLAWALVEEQFGRSTNALSWHVPNAYNVWSVAGEEQIERWLRPMLRGEAQDAYAVIEALAAAYRCADRAVQAFGGRGYRRDNVAERFLRELRVDRIWEGTSEIQRLIIARALERRGVARVLR
jgi:alkylation response protein AidB-like acyl-CoA dehydrogenase